MYYSLYDSEEKWKTINESDPLFNDEGWFKLLVEEEENDWYGQVEMMYYWHIIIEYRPMMCYY